MRTFKKFGIALVTACLCLAASPSQAVSPVAQSRFAHRHACPSTGMRHLPCRGYVVDYIVPLKCGGSNTLHNMRWVTEREYRRWGGPRARCRHGRGRR
jgi:hypothetical protein